MTDQIKQNLRQLFNRHRVVFWYDAHQEWEAFVDALQLDDVELVKPMGRTLSTKYRVLRGAPEQRFLLYFPTDEPATEDNWLLDVQLSGCRFYPDRASMALLELGLPTKLQTAFEVHIEFAKAQSRMNRLRTLLQGRTEADPGELQRLMIAAVCQVDDPSLESILLRLWERSHAGSEDEQRALRRCRLWDVLWRLVAEQYGYASASPSLKDFALALFEHELAPLLGSHSSLSEKAPALMARWKDSRGHREVYDGYAQAAEEAYSLGELKPPPAIELLLDLDTVAWVDRTILVYLLQAIDHDASSPQEIGQIIQRRRRFRWWSRFEHHYSALDAGAQLLFQLRHVNLSMAGLAEGVQRYAASWFRMDQLYREFLLASRKADHQGLLDDLDQRIGKHYREHFLRPLAESWQRQVDQAAQWGCDEILSLRQVFSQRIRPVLDQDRKLCVIISDAFRYELGEELQRRILQKDKYQCELEPALSPLPSITSLGMAALLPHQRLSLVDDGSALADGEKTAGLSARQTRLQTGLAEQKVATMGAEAFLNQTHDESRALFRDHDLVYVYHNTVDQVGDKRDSEGKVFEAAAQAMEELQQLVLKATTANFSRLLVTADHGFLFHMNELEASDFLVLPEDEEAPSKRNRRFLIGGALPDCSGLSLHEASQLGLDESPPVFIARNLQRLRQHGSGTRYVHGGASLQEVVVPVLRITKRRDSDVRKVDVDLISPAQRVITTAQVALTFYQREAVTEKVQPRALRVALYDKAGEQISNAQELHFDIESEEPRSRELTCRLQLTGKADESKKRDVMLHLEEAIDQTNRYRIFKTYPFQLRKSFTSDFDF
jgi:uncharacterized protein (TIGR02687 family)